jgi:hypothetical protein
MAILKQRKGISKDLPKGELKAVKQLLNPKDTSRCKFCNSTIMGSNSLDLYGRCPLCCVNSFEDKDGEFVLVYDSKSVMDAHTKRGRYNKVILVEAKYIKIYLKDTKTKK